MRFVFAILGLMLAMPAVAQDAAPLRVGVIGVITHLNPVQINGLTLDIGPDTPVISPLGPRSGKTLRLGHTVAVTLQDMQDRWGIKRILHIYPLIGPVTEVKDDTLNVMGSRVVGPITGMFDEIKPGYWVGISGFWNNDGALVATRVGAIPATGFAQLSGSYVPPKDDTSNAMIGGTEIVGALEPDVEIGDMWTLSGTAQKGALRVGLKSSRLFAGEVDIVVAQGFASDPIASETYTLLGTGLTGTAKEVDLPDNSDVTFVCGAGGMILRVLPQQEDMADLSMRLGCF